MDESFGRAIPIRLTQCFFDEEELDSEETFTKYSAGNGAGLFLLWQLIILMLFCSSIGKLFKNGTID
ncbi:hypothetical protein GX408_08255 [bacterium]|nr:hypothetical protein [bacterium]